MSARLPLYQFAHRLLPEQFFRQPEHWMTRLSASGGQALLHDLWHSQDPCYEPFERSAAQGLHYYFERVHTSWRVIIVEFQQPEQPCEPFFAAMAWRPAELLFLIFPRNAQASRYFVAERGSDQDSADVIEWSSDGTYSRHETLKQPTSANFLASIMRLTAR